MAEYNFCPRCGQPLQDTFLHGRVRPTCPACGYVVYLDPKVGAGVVVELDGKVVMVRRAMNPMRGHWSLPSGYVERDEAPDATAVRETREETGLEVVLDNLLNVYSFSHEGTGGRGVLVLYAAHATGGELRAGDDAAEVGTFGPDEIPPDVAFATHRQALRDWQRAKAIVYRPATAGDVPAVAEMNAAHRAEIGVAFDPGQVRRRLALRGRAVGHCRRVRSPVAGDRRRDGQPRPDLRAAQLPPLGRGHAAHADGYRAGAGAGSAGGAFAGAGRQPGAARVHQGRFPRGGFGARRDDGGRAGPGPGRCSLWSFPSGGRSD